MAGFILAIAVVLATSGTVSAATTPAMANVIGRVSVTSSDLEAHGQSASPAISADGRHIAFDSYAPDLVAGDSNRAPDVFVRDVAAKKTIRVSVSSSGAEANGPSEGPSISDDGRFVAFVSLANLTSTHPPLLGIDALALPDPGGDQNGTFDVYVHDRDADGDGVFDEPGGVATNLASISSDGQQGNDWSLEPHLSGDGRYLAFSSYATTLVPGDTSHSDVFLRDLAAGTTSKITRAIGGGNANQSSFSPALSYDGRHVAFTSIASDLAEGDANNEQDVYVIDRATAVVTRASKTRSSGDANGGSWSPSLSDDGTRVAFTSAATNLVRGDTNGVTDVFVRDIAGKRTLLTSISTTGKQADDNSLWPDLSGNGAYVAFHSMASNLAAGSDVSSSGGFGGDSDVFVHHLATRTTTRVSVSVAGEEGNGHSGSPVLSADGLKVAFDSSASNLVPGDTNEEFDVFLRG